MRLGEEGDPGGDPVSVQAVSGAAGALPAPGEALVRRSSGEQAALYIRRLIFDGRLRQGDRVPQDDIARALGVSRIPVREALLSLEREGWVTIRPHRGAFIGALDEAAVRDHYTLYGLVFGFAARRATERRTPELTERLAGLCAGLEGTDDPAEVARLTRESDRLILETASSPRLRSVLRAMVGVVPGNFFALVPGPVEAVRAGRRAIHEAIADGDPDRAAGAYARMLRRQGDLVARLFEEKGLFAKPA
ncbi:GntR family transcriptional regulator [Actinomadura viridis]|uniref:DNA-binding GntR family transcriptional regulator n=1 Tax=Actinomadura viridis TaxID=58110 RepID=A0A931DGZ1_9ACTN|nr:GntR family transcriptional regulator [Actinomadura viridis]MBG6089092.1 DNA-binding GntR family transcriptional regulator [Actinomadura viridis]